MPKKCFTHKILQTKERNPTGVHSYLRREASRLPNYSANSSLTDIQIFTKVQPKAHPLSELCHNFTQKRKPTSIPRTIEARNHARDYALK
jgi:hypothetical protein